LLIVDEFREPWKATISYICKSFIRPGKQALGPILCIGDARLGGSDAAGGVEHAAVGADHTACLAHAAHECEAILTIDENRSG
jgi:hypothetical protein